MKIFKYVINLKILCYKIFILFKIDIFCIFYNYIFKFLKKQTIFLDIKFNLLTIKRSL